MTRSRNLRLYRACRRCRQRKLKCEPTASQDGTSPSCLQCLRAGDACVLAGSRRGGDFSRFRRSRRDESKTPGRADDSQAGDGIDEEAEDPINTELRNAGDALQILARLAASGSPPNQQTLADKSSPNGPAATPSTGVHYSTPPAAASPLEASETENLLIKTLGIDIVKELLRSYAANYHTFCPLIPHRLLAPSDPRRLANDEPFLLAVMLTIASKDETVYRDIHQRCWLHLKAQLLDILLAAHWTLNVGSVEGLLLLSEWVPYLQAESTNQSALLPGNLKVAEDNTAWSLIGQAVRHSYLLRLDKASFRETAAGEVPELANRKRLAWVFVYIADRQISVRMGQSFWSRGPGLSTRFTADDFPSLRLSSDAEHKYAHVLQATVELTQLLHNVHDIFYASSDRRIQMIRRGDYNRYLDDFRSSLSAWQDRWDDLQASPKLNTTLSIAKEYVRLYASAFAFQSVLFKAVHDSRRAGRPTAANDSGRKRTQSLFPQGIMATSEGAYVLEAVDAARKILTIAVQASPEMLIRFMPFRFYVYTVYASVFLYRADIFGALLWAQNSEIADLVQQFIRVLEDAATSEYHTASRFAALLRLMWVSRKQTAAPGAGAPLAEPPSMSYTPSFVAPPPQQHFEIPQNMIPGDSQLRDDIVPGMLAPESLYWPTPDFNLFNLDLSSLESELVDRGVGALGFHI